MNLCRDCKHYNAHPLDADFDKCWRTHETQPNRVRGGVVPLVRYCQTERESDSETRCGPGARFYEPALVTA